jgi:uncharacterized coiled-coil DUF342 family protein
MKGKLGRKKLYLSVTLLAFSIVFYPLGILVAQETPPPEAYPPSPPLEEKKVSKPLVEEEVPVPEIPAEPIEEIPPLEEEIAKPSVEEAPPEVAKPPTKKAALPSFIEGITNLPQRLCVRFMSMVIPLLPGPIRGSVEAIIAPRIQIEIPVKEEVVPEEKAAPPPSFMEGITGLLPEPLREIMGRVVPSEMEVTGLVPTITGLVKKMDGVFSTVLDLEKEINELKEEILKLRERIPSPVEGLSVLNSERKEKIDGEVFELRKKISELNNNLSELRGKASDLKTRLCELKKELPTEGEEAFLMMSDMREEVLWMDEWISGMEKDILSVKQEVERLNKKASRLIRRIPRSYTMLEVAMVEDVRKEIERLTEEVSVLDKEINRITKEVKDQVSSEKKSWKRRVER